MSKVVGEKEWCPLTSKVVASVLKSVKSNNNNYLLFISWLSILIRSSHVNQPDRSIGWRGKVYNAV